METVAIVGAGISGLSIGQCLKKDFTVTIFEQSSKPGGLIACETIEGNLFHKVGGHVFNAKNKEVFDWFWSFFNKETEFIKAKRNAKIWLENQWIGYPIENHIYQLRSDIGEQVLVELLAIFRSHQGGTSLPDNFEDFLLRRFGPTLNNLYFRPYNTKIWQTDLSQMPLEWLEGKLPTPNFEEILNANVFHLEEREMVHSTFYYPKEGGSQFIADRLAKGLDILYNSPISRIEKVDTHFLINRSKGFDKIIYTGDVRKLVHIYRTDSHEIKKAMQEVMGLKSNGTSNVFCECDPNDLSWLYLPDTSLKAHRIIYTGNFSPANNRGSIRSTCVVEFMGKVETEIMEEEIKNLPGNLVPLAYNFEPNSYVIQRHGDRDKVNELKELLAPLGFHLLGRFAEWEYYNMDKAIEKALQIRV